MPGGFVGVDVFFVLSGFLITGILLRELDLSNTIDLKGFFIRRALRLIPALWIMTASLAALLLVAPIYSRRTFAIDAGWALSFMSDWYQAFVARSGDNPFFVHTWSLSVEQQFYLTWPLLLVTLSSRISRGALFATIVITIAAITLWRWYLIWSGASWLRLYFSFDTRIDQLLVGCGLAVAISIPAWRFRLETI